MYFQVLIIKKFNFIKSIVLPKRYLSVFLIKEKFFLKALEIILSDIHDSKLKGNNLYVNSNFGLQNILLKLNKKFIKSK